MRDEIDRLYRAYLATPVEDWEARQRIELSDQDFDQLHDLCLEGKADWDLWRKVDIARKADAHYLEGARAKGWTITRLREQLSMETKHQYSKGEEHITEIRSNRCWPIFQHIRRTRKRGSRTILEVELAFPPEAEAGGVVEKYIPEFEEESLLLSQKGFGDVAFLPPEGIEYKVVVSAGGSRKEFEFPVALRYGPLLWKFSKLPLEDTKWKPHAPAKGSPGALGGYPPNSLQKHSRYELGEGLLGLWVAVLEYDPQKVQRIPGYIKLRLTWHMQDAYKAQSTEAFGQNRLFKQGRKRTLKGRLERSGGELDAPVNPDDEGGSATRHDRLPDHAASPADEWVLIQEICAIIPDEKDRWIIWLRTKFDLTNKETADLLGLSPSAVSQRTKKLQGKVRKILEN